MSDQVAEIKSKIDIAGLIGERVQLKQRGQRFLALCPFHSEKTPSFTVSPEIGIFKCFGCGAAGDAFTFLERYEGMNFVEALEYLADRVGVKLERRVVDSQLASIDRQIFEVNHLAAEYFHFLLATHKVGERARQYLQKRHVAQSAIDHYFLGYAPARWDSLLTFLKKKGYKLELLEKAGLVIKRTSPQHQSSLPSEASGLAPVKSDGAGSGRASRFSNENLGSSGYDRFRGRIMFPLRDSRGQVVGFAGRLIHEEVYPEQSRGAKYINSPETSVYHKGKHLFGIFENKEEIRKQDRVILVEGELDTISSWQAGVRNVVAVKGTALTQDQVKLIRRYTRNVTVALDSDEAGWDALVRSLPILESQGMNVRVVIMPRGIKDPDDLARADPKSWRELVKHAANVYDALISGTISRIGVENGEQKKQVSEKIVPLLVGITNVIEQDHWISEVAARLGVRVESVLRQMEHSRSGIKESLFSHKKESQEAQKLSRQETLSRYLLALLVQSGRSAPSELSLEWIAPIGIQKIIEQLSAQTAIQKKKDIRKLRENLPAELHELFDEAALTMIGGGQSENFNVDQIDEEIKQTLIDLERTWIKHQLQQERAYPDKIMSLTRRLREIQASG